MECQNKQRTLYSSLEKCNMFTVANLSNFYVLFSSSIAVLVFSHFWTL